ncbi:MAG: glycosyltransferase family 9 protein [Deltaproteobacteria bacterium]|nr:glycosyltransferase family 9 protein [Deltaproteobacteria bacterium]
MSELLDVIQEHFPLSSPSHLINILSLMIQYLFNLVFRRGSGYLGAVSSLKISQPKSVLIILRRYRGDVLLALPLIASLKNEFTNIKIDLLINPQTEDIALLLPYVRKIHVLREYYKFDSRILRFCRILGLSIRFFRKYDLSINLTTNDAGAFLSWASATVSMSVCEVEKYKSWWKKMLLSYTYHYEKSMHTVTQSLKPLSYLKIEKNTKYTTLKIMPVEKKIKFFLRDHRLFLIFHPSTQFNYKIMPQNVINRLLEGITELNLPIIVTGGLSDVDIEISKNLPRHDLIHNFISKTTMSDLAYLTSGCIAYIGMDTFNMHLAALYKKRIFAIFGPTLPQMWAPWTDDFSEDMFAERKTIYRYGGVTIFQADLPCVPCDRKGCNGLGISECLSFIAPQVVVAEVKKWLKSVSPSSKADYHNTYEGLEVTD